MDLTAIEQIAKNLMSERKSHLEREKGDVFYHGRRVAKLSTALREAILPDEPSHDGTLTVASWFHDCAKGIEPHAEYGAIIAKKALKSSLLPDELDMVCNLILLHCSRGYADSRIDTYAKILQDADIIDHFGIFEIWMSIQYLSHTEGTMDDMARYYETNHDSHTKTNRQLLNFDISKEIFDGRVAFEKEFISRLKSEGKGEIYRPFQQEEQ